MSPTEALALARRALEQGDPVTTREALVALSKIVKDLCTEPDTADHNVYPEEEVAAESEVDAACRLMWGDKWWWKEHLPRGFPINEHTAAESGRLCNEDRTRMRAFLSATAPRSGLSEDTRHFIVRAAELLKRQREIGNYGTLIDYLAEALDRLSPAASPERREGPGIEWAPAWDGHNRRKGPVTRRVKASIHDHGMRRESAPPHYGPQAADRRKAKP